jgi:hypothetical protein
MSNNHYKQLYLDPRCLRPHTDNIPNHIYKEALEAINEGIIIASEYYDYIVENKLENIDTIKEIELLKEIEKIVFDNMKKE